MLFLQGLNFFTCHLLNVNFLTLSTSMILAYKVEKAIESGQ